MYAEPKNGLAEGAKRLQWFFFFIRIPRRETSKRDPDRTIGKIKPMPLVQNWLDANAA